LLFFLFFSFFLFFFFFFLKRRVLSGTVLLFPAMSPTMEEGRVVSFLKEKGEEFKADEALFTVETDKATLDVDAVDDGVIAHVLVEMGEVVKVGEPIAVLVEPGEDWQNAEKPEKEKALSAAPAAPTAAPIETTQPRGRTDVQRTKAGGAQLRFPSTERLLVRYGLAREAVQGSGRLGQVLKGDVLAHVKTLQLRPVELPAKQTAATVSVSEEGWNPRSYLQVEAPLGRAAEMVMAAAGEGGAGALAVRACVSAGLMGAEGAAVAVERAAGGVMVKGVVGKTDSLGVVAQVLREGNNTTAAFAQIGVSDYSDSGVMASGTIRTGQLGWITVGPVAQKPHPSGEGVMSTIPISLAYDVNVEEDTAYLFLNQVAAQFQSPSNV
jgi:pyruvate/2-oxoglutarate dehydrogenase complex dihydrolipoamide acyltransferase (E2) component